MLVYHSIAETDGDPKRELLPPIARDVFARQLTHLRRHYNLVELGDLPAAMSSRRRGGRFPVAITLDDDLPQHVTSALPELLAAGAPATFFLCGSFLGAGPSEFWWQRLQRAVDAGHDLAPIRVLLPLDGKVDDIHRLAAAIETTPPDQRDRIDATLTALVGAPPEDEVLSISLARELVVASVGVGFHTRRHDLLPRLDDAQLERALTDGREALEVFAGQPVDAIAYPYGKANERVALAAARAGFRIGVTGGGTALTPLTDPLLVGRIEPRPGLSMREFALQLVRPLLVAGSETP